LLELKSDLKPREMISLNDRTRLIVYLAKLTRILNLINFECSLFDS